MPGHKESVNFVHGLRPVCSAGGSETRNGLAVYVYSANTSMNQAAFNNSDGDFLFGKTGLILRID